jgi:hypothetical protein
MIYIELEEDRPSRERDETYRRNREAERLRLEEKFLSGADSGWTPVKRSVDLYCRRNGRALRISRGKTCVGSFTELIASEMPETSSGRTKAEATQTKRFNK